MIGERLREVRQTQGKSLAEVAGKANISVATLSRIETDKQSVGVDLLITLAGVLGTEPREILGDGGGGREDLAQRIAGLDTKKRAELWRELAAERRARRNRPRTSRDLGQQVEELLAQIDFLREELEAVRSRVNKRR